MGLTEGAVQQVVGFLVNVELYVMLGECGGGGCLEGFAKIAR